MGRDSQAHLPDATVDDRAHHEFQFAQADARQDDMQRHYRAFKAEILAEGARGEFDIHDMELCLRRLSRMCRLMEQALKAAATLRSSNLSADQTVIQDKSHPLPPPDTTR